MTKLHKYWQDETACVILISHWVNS